MKHKTITSIYSALNTSVFNNLLVQPTILFTRLSDAHAQFVDGIRSRMEFNPVDICGLSHANALVYHEMIHQYLEDVLEVDEVDHHGPIFWQYYEYFNPGKIELGVNL